MARQVLENGVILPAEYSDDWYDDMTSNLTKLDDVIGSDSEKLSSSDVGAAALSNNYNDLDNLPTIPTVNDATLTIQKNGVDVETFTDNASSNVTANITVPTKTSDLTNDSNFVDTSNSAVSSGITSAKVTNYDTHIADADKHVTTSDKTSWNTVTSKANDSDVVHKSGNETVAGQKTLVNLLPLKGEALGTEASNNARSLLYFLANRDTQNQSGIFLTKFRQNKAQGDMSGNDIAYLSFDCLENSVRTNNGLRINFLNFVDDIPQRFILWSGISEKLLGVEGAPWSGVYATNYYYGSNNVEFSTKFVTTDTNQTITSNKTF